MSNEDLEALREKEKITATNFIEKKKPGPFITGRIFRKSKKAWCL